MDIQSILTLTIEIIFWAFVALIIFDFTNRLFALEVPNTTPAISFTQDVVTEPTPAAVIDVVPQFEQLPDPWVLDVESSNPSAETHSVLINPNPVSQGRYVDPIKRANREGEILFPPDTRFQVQSTEIKQYPVTEMGETRELVVIELNEL